MRLALAIALVMLAAAPERAHALDVAGSVLELRDGSDASVRVAAANVLGASGDVAYEDALALGLERDVDEGVRAACARALGRLRGPRAFVLLATAAHDGSDVVRGAAAAAIRALRPPPPAYCTDGIYAAVWHPTHDLAICSDGTFHPRARRP